MPTTKRKLSTVAQIVEAFGGTKAASKWADVGMSAVSNWIEREYIPPGWHFRMAAELGRRGFEIDPAVFGIIRSDDRAASAKRSETRRIA